MEFNYNYELLQTDENFAEKYMLMGEWCKENNAYIKKTENGYLIVEIELPKLGFELLKDDYNFSSRYIGMIDWCRANNAHIVEKANSYVIVENKAPKLEEVQKYKLKKIKEARDKAEEEPIEYNGNVFDFDEKARERISMARDVLANGGTLMWTTADDNSVEVNAEALGAIVLAAAVRSNTLHTKYRTLKEAVLNATTVEEIEALSFE